MSRTSAVTPDKFATFGELLKYLRRRAGLTQRELSIAVGYSESQVSRLEQNQRAPDEATLAARFVPALHIDNEPEWVGRLLELATRFEGEPEAGGSETRTPPNNLPIQLTRFIGREKEITQIRRCLTEYRLVTLTGSGGIGKTRLAIQAARELLPDYVHGAWLVELAPLADPTLVPQAVATALGVRDESGRPLLAVLTDYLREKTLLLILDNCEHLVEACARLIESLIKFCPKLHVLASSREAFGIAGEQPYRVPSLAFPDPKHLPSLEEISKCESVQLFIERVKAYVPIFTLTEKNASSVAQICCHLDGIPLTIELAAARVKVMSVEQMASRLGDIFNLLTSGSRTALPRHQTLRALIEWSYELLSDSEKTVFRRLAAFSGGWSLEAAESVCGGEGIESVEVIDILSKLVDKSLVIKEENDGEARFHMLETIRQYAQFKMFASEEVDDTKNRHRDWFMQLAETAEPKLRTGEQLPWLNRLEMEHYNLRAAMNWSVEQKHVEQALRIPSALAYFWEIHGHHEEGRNWFIQALGLDEGNARSKYSFAWANAVHGHFILSWELPDYQSFRPHLEDALKIFREHGDDFRVGHTLYHLAVFPYLSGELETAKSIHEESLGVYRKINNQWGVGNCLHCIAHDLEGAGDVEESHQAYRQSLDMLRPIGDRFSLYHPVGDTALIAMNKGELSTAKAIIEESIQAFEELGNRAWVSISFRRLAEVLYEQGNYANTREMLERAHKVATEINDLSQLSWIAATKGEVELAEGDFASARQTFSNAFEIAEKANDQELIGRAKASTGLIDCFEGNFARGKEAIEFGIEKMLKQYAPGASPLMTYRGLAFWLEKNLPRAAQSYRDTILELQKNYYFIRIPECLEGLAKIAVTQNDLERCARLFGAAGALREKMGTPLHPVERADYERSVAAVRGASGVEAFAAAWEEGRGLTLEQAVAFSLEDSTGLG